MSSLALRDMQRVSQRFLSSPNTARAERWLRKVHSHHPNDPVTMTNLAAIAYNKGEDDAAVRWITEAHRHTGARSNCAHLYTKALIDLKNGNWQEGWTGLEFRFAIGETRPKAPFEQLWDGSYLGPERRLVLWGEQGLGDMIQMVRFLPEVRKWNGCRVVLNVPPTLVKLFKPFADEVSDEVKLLPDDLHAPLFSLPRILNILPATLDGTPYIKRPRAAKRLKEQFLVGLCWKGSQETPELRDRSIAEEELRPVQENCCWRSLQYGEHGFEPKDWVETAKAVSECDLVITVDTSLAHLAGALGIPTWLMLRYQGDWRWLRERTDSPWYSTMQLFRQPKMGDWASVVQNVSNDLKARMV